MASPVCKSDKLGEQHVWLLDPKAHANSWDEWVPESRIVKLNEENKQLCRRLLHAQTAKGGKNVPALLDRGW